VARLVHLKPFLPRHTDVLEVGCGQGFITEELVKNNCQVTGIDYSKAAIATASKLPGQYILTDIYHYRPTQKFSFIVCSEVLEHLKDDKKALQLMYSWLSPGGRLLISVPTFMPFTTIIQRNSGHYRHYRPQNLISLVRQVGFEVEKQKPWGCLSRRLILCYLTDYVTQIPHPLLSLIGTVFGPLIQLETRLWPLPDSLILLLKKPSKK